MNKLEYSLIIESTEEPDFFGFYSPDLEGFTGIGNTIGDCLTKAQQAIPEHLEMLRQENLPVPEPNPNASVTIKDRKRVTPTA